MPSDGTQGRRRRHQPLLGDDDLEALSPTTLTYDRATKSRRYAALGIPHLWIVDPDSRRLEGYRLEGQAYRPVLQPEGDRVVEHPDWPDLAIRPGDLCL